MANWKKVIVSGSNAELNHITASGDITASGYLFGSMSINESLQYIVVWNPVNGRLERKLYTPPLSTQEAPPLFLADLGPYTGETDGESGVHFRLSYDTGSTNSGLAAGIQEYFVLSASKDGGSTYTIPPTHSETGIPGDGTILGGDELGDDYNWVGLNDIWADSQIENDIQLYDLSVNQGTYTGIKYTELKTVRNGLIVGTSKKDIRINLQGFDEDAVPAYPTLNAGAGVLFPNYSASAFRDGGIGELQIFFNDNDTAARAIDLETETNTDEIAESAGAHASGIYFDKLHATQSNAESSTGDLVTQPGKHYRSGSFVIEAADQNDGYNYCYIIHTGSKDGEDFCYITNFVEWFYDVEGAAQALAVSGESNNISSDNFDNTATGIDYVSGIKFYNENAFASPIEYIITCSNQYRNVYRPSEGIRFEDLSPDTLDVIHVTQSGETSQGNYQVTTLDSVTVGSSIAVSFDQAPLKNIVAPVRNSTTEVSSSIEFSFDTELFHQPNDFTDDQDSSFTYVPWGPGDGVANISWQVKFLHITDHKANILGTAQDESDFLVNTHTSNATEHNFEDFKREDYRIQKGTYTDINTNSPTGSSFAWNSEQDLSGTPAAGYQDALVLWDTHVIHPLATGDDTTPGDYDTTLGPTNQPDYTGLTGTREYYRYFALTSLVAGADQLNFEFVGDARIVPETNTADFQSGQKGIKVYVNRTARVNTGGPFNEVFKNVLENGVTTYSAFQNDQYVPVFEDYPSYVASDNETISTSVPGGASITVKRGIASVIDTGKTFSTDDVVILKIVIPEGSTASINAIGITKANQSANTNRVLTGTVNSSDF